MANYQQSIHISIPPITIINYGDNNNNPININITVNSDYYIENRSINDSYNRPAPKFDNNRAIEGIFNGVSNLLSHLLN